MAAIVDRETIETIMNVEKQDPQDILFPVAEYFISINGEGLSSGYLSAFVRLRGCNLRCNYCDTEWACNPDCPVSLMTARQILDKIQEDGVDRVTLTGGEPLLSEGIEILISLLTHHGIQVEIETNGSVSILPYLHLSPRPAFTLDYKCPASGMESFMVEENFRCLDRRDCVKFVVSDRQDLLKAREVADSFELDRQCSVILSPVFGRIEPGEIVEFMKEHKWNSARIQLQMHKFIWPPDMRGV